MAPSQLKQLKASLHKNGVLGPQKSRKTQKSNQRDASKRQERNNALASIREQFNPFEVKAPARREKFDISSNKHAKRTVERPGVTRGLGEERRRTTLLKEMQSRHKVGGLLDRRFGEDDPDITPEQKAAERFAQQAMRTNRKNSIFNLEDGDDDGEGDLQLTHGGHAIVLENGFKDDFEDEIVPSDVDDFDVQDDRPRKRARTAGEDGSELEEEELTRRKTKKEVMQEVIAKSKMYKAQRQAAKEDDDDLRDELNKGMGEMFAALRGHTSSNKQLPSPPQTDTEPSVDPVRAAILAGKPREQAEKEYEANVRQLKLEAKSKPSVRTKSDDEKAAEEKERLEGLERRRLRRMRGEPDSSDEDDMNDDTDENVQDEDRDDAQVFGLAQPMPRYLPQLEVEEEDDFVLDDIIASGSESLSSVESGEDELSNAGSDAHDGDGDDDFINGLVLPKSIPVLKHEASKLVPESDSKLGFVYPCPQNLQEMVDIAQSVDHDDIPTVVQRIRALYHKGLAQENGAKLARFSRVLLQFIAHATCVQETDKERVPMSVIEQLIRHLHSMGKTQPNDVAEAFQQYLAAVYERDCILHAGDLVVLTAAAAIFPTSDQWHPIVTPAILVMAKYLAQGSLEHIRDLAMGSYCCALMLKYQMISRRYIPEVTAYIARALHLLAPADLARRLEHELSQSIMLMTNDQFRIKDLSITFSKLPFEQIRQHDCRIKSEHLLAGFLAMVEDLVEVWSDKIALPELLEPISILVTGLDTTLSDKLRSIMTLKIAVRTPLILHSHRPQAIKSSYPQFIEDYNPERRHHDPDKERAEINKLKREHKKEQKGAMRELRKDANFMAREQLREKKAKDAAYEKKFKRLVAEIQGEEGAESNRYNVEKRKRQGKF